ncbi:MAG: tetratricopeptide repeat protein [Verrucomicrobia bacterium]|nr:tetratricopeptide repeat protein [Verrucomicrobiota bacterium]
MRNQIQKLRLDGCICLALGIITLALYLPALRHDFLTYDDQQYVTENSHVRDGLSSRSLAWAFGNHAGNWHPLTWLSHMLDCQVYGLKPAGHHLTNVLLHVANTVLLFLVLNRMTGAVWRSAFVAALFGWHPSHVESVAWVAERKDVLSAFFWVLTLGAYARYVEQIRVPSPKSTASKVVWYGVTLALFTLGLMSKPMMVTLPFVLLLLDYWPLQRLQLKAQGSKFKTLSSLIREKTPFFVLTIIACVLTISAQSPAIASTTGLPVSQRIWHAPISYVHYLSTTLVPYHMAVYYPYEMPVPVPDVLLSCFLLLLITGLAFRFSGRRPYIVTGWLWFLGTLVPVIGLIQVGDQAWADRYTYLPIVGLFMALVWGATEVISNRLVLRATAVSIATALLAVTTLQLRHWQNTRTLFEHAAQVTEKNYMAITVLGSEFAKEGRLSNAIAHYETALRWNPGFPEARFFLGRALDEQGNFDEAIVEYRRALRLNPHQEQTHVFLGVALARKGKYDEAAACYVAALKLNPESAVAHNNLARLFHTQGRLDEAVEHYSSAVKSDPGLAQAHNNLGILLLQKGDSAEGADHLREALRLNPGNAESQYNLALALNQLERWSEAAELFAKTVGGGSADPNAHCQFAGALAHLQKTREAMSHYASALLIQPDFVDALDGLSWILSTDPNPEFRNGVEAVRMAERACELSGRNDPVKLKTLAAAYAEAGRFPEAITTARSAQAAAGSDRKKLVMEMECRLMLESFQSSKPWRE